MANLELNCGEFTPIKRILRDILDSEGVQYIFKFDNGYGASVIKYEGSYGYRQDLWELAVLLFDPDDPDYWELCYDTQITDDVKGHLTDEKVRETLKQIKELKPIF